MKNTYKASLVTAAAAAAMLGLAGCGSAQHTAGSSVTTSQHASSGSTASPSTPAATLSAWLTDIVEGDYMSACTKMAVSANGSATGTPTPGTPALCTKVTQTGTISTSPESIIKDLHASFTPKSLSGQPSITVDAPSATGSTVTVDSKQISINGTPLDQVIVSNSTGVTTSELQVTFSLIRLSGTWYVSNFNLNV